MTDIITQQESNERIEKLCQALESGKYNQTTNALKVNRNNPHLKSGYCCLGLGCEIYHQETGDGAWEPSRRIGVEKFVVDGDCPAGIMPTKVAKWFGLPLRIQASASIYIGDIGGSNPEISCMLDGNSRVGASLSELNDTDNLSFKEIAALIRKEFIK